MPTRNNVKSQRVVKITQVIDENPKVKTLMFKDSAGTRAGQFVMVWIPGIDEVPMSISIVGEEKGMTVKEIGEATRALNQLKPGDMIAIRGPYGNFFSPRGRNILVVAGGIGIAPILPFIEGKRNEEERIFVALGAVNQKELVFEKRLQNHCHKLKIATDDGSFGFHGFVTDLAKQMVEEEGIDEILTCGPEIMIAKMVDFARQKSMKIQASLERFMKCGVGICDSCALNGFHVCRDGPVFSEEVLFNLADLGRFRRDSSGRKIKL